MIDIGNVFITAGFIIITLLLSSWSYRCLHVCKDLQETSTSSTLHVRTGKEGEVHMSYAIILQAFSNINHPFPGDGSAFCSHFLVLLCFLFDLYRLREKLHHIKGTSKWIIPSLFQSSTNRLEKKRSLPRVIIEEVRERRGRGERDMGEDQEDEIGLFINHSFILV